jgi:hypothetical protein
MAPAASGPRARRNPERDALVGADQALSLAQVAGPYHDLALRVEEERGARARDAGEEGLEDSAVGHGPTSAAP